MQGPSGIESLLFIFEITPQADFYPNIINIGISLNLQNNVIFFSLSSLSLSKQGRAVVGGY